MKARTTKKVSALLLTGGFLLGGGGCIVEDFWVTQLDNTLTTMIDAVVADTAVVAIDNALLTEED